MSIDARLRRIEALPEAVPDSDNHQARIQAVSIGCGDAADSAAGDRSATSAGEDCRRRAPSQSAGTASAGGSGRPSALAEGQRRELAEALQASPAQHGYEAARWSGTLVARYLREHQGIAISSRQGQRLLKEFGYRRPVVKHRKARTLEHARPDQEPAAVRRARPAWDALNKEIALRRIKRLASSGLPLVPYVLTLLQLINDGVPSAPNRPFLASGEHTDAYIGDTPEVYAIVPAQQHYFVHSGSELSGLKFRHSLDVYKSYLPTKPTWLMEEWMLPHFYRSEGFNEVFRKLGYHHMVFVSFVEQGEPVGFYPMWRGPDQPPYNCEDIRFLHAIIPHVAHGLRAARMLADPTSTPAVSGFTPLDHWGSGVVLLDSRGKVVGADDRARLLFSYLVRFDSSADTSCEVSAALDHIARTLMRIFCAEGENAIASPAPVVRLYSHRSGIVLRLRGILTPGIDGKDYFTVIVEAGELEAHRICRLSHRWGLAPRDTHVLTALADGLATSKIATRLRLQPDTVKSYTRRLIEKLELTDRAALRLFARQHFKATTTPEPPP